MKTDGDIVVFACNWDGLSCVEAAGHSGASYPVSVKVIRVGCICRVHFGLILKAFELGAGGVVLLGCEPGSCYFGKDDEFISREYKKTRGVLGLLGVGEKRLKLMHLPRGDGAGFVKQIGKFISEIGQT